MIRQEHPNGVLLITQAAHAFMCGQFAHHWNYTPLHPYDEIVYAIANHDAGWHERDAKPLINAQGQPRTFTELDLEDHFSIWERGFGRVLNTNRYAGLMVTLHATTLYQRRLVTAGRTTAEDRPHIKAFIDKWTAIQQGLIEELAATYPTSPAKLTQNRDLLQTFDWMSLLLLMQIPYEPHPQAISEDHSITLAAPSEGIVTVSPWVFDVDEITLTVEGRWLEQPVYPDDAALQAAYQAAPVHNHEVRIIRGE